MSAAWNAVRATAERLCPTAPLRMANLLIAAACSHDAAKGRKVAWDGKVARGTAATLALTALPKTSADARAWQHAATAAWDARHLGGTPEAMHEWAAAYQRASTTQKALGAYATHDAFASALARITMAPMDAQRIHRIVDPSVGAGNLLLAALEQFGRGRSRTQLRRFILALHGVELDPQARELCCLLLWLAGQDAGVGLEQVAANIQLGNALTRDWWSTGDLFDVVLMNPPWESLRHKVDDEDGERAATLRRMLVPKDAAPGLPPLYTAQGSGDRNLFKAFVELVPHLLVEGGRLGALIPAAFASDAGMAELRERYLNQFEIARWTSYENRGGYFPIDGRYKFGLLAATRSNRGTQQLSVRSFATHPDEVDAPHINLRRGDIGLIGGQYHIIPELARREELAILRQVLRHGTPLFAPGALGTVTYRREVDLSLGKGKFQHVRSEPLRPLSSGLFENRKGKVFAPLLEGRLVGAYDCFQKSWVSGAARTAVWEDNGTRPVDVCTPQYVMEAVEGLPSRVAICDVTAATNTRTVIATLVPDRWRCGNTAPVLEFQHPMLALAGLGILNSMVFDWVARRMVSGLHLNKFILEGMVWPRLDTASVERIALAAWSCARAQPRSGLDASALRAPPWRVAKENRHALAPVQAAISIELAVAHAFGLSLRELSAIYDANPDDRRGFWRFFRATPIGLEVAHGVLGEVVP